MKQQAFETQSEVNRLVPGGDSNSIKSLRAATVELLTSGRTGADSRSGSTTAGPHSRHSLHISHKSAHSLHSTSAEVVEELEKTNPALLAWLRNGGPLLQSLLLFLYVFCETIGALLTSFALRPDSPDAPAPLASSLVVLNNGTSIIIGLFWTLGTAACQERRIGVVPKSLGAVFHWRSIVAYFPVAALISIAQVFSMMSYAKLDAGLKKILDQLRLPMTAALSSVTIGRRYSLREWLTLLIVFLAVCAFYIADVQHDAVTEMHTKCNYPQSCFDEPTYDICALRVDGHTIVGSAVSTAVKGRDGTKRAVHDITTFPVEAAEMDWAGLQFSLLASLFSCLGVLLWERLMKSTSETPFSVQKVQKELTGMPVALAMSFIVPLWIDPKGGQAIWWTKTGVVGSGGGFFQGYSELTVLALAIDIFLVWMSGLIVKQFSALVLVISKCVCVVLTVFFAGTFFKVCQADPLPPTMYSLAFVIAAATFLFATIPKEREPPPPAPLSPQASAREPLVLTDESAAPTQEGGPERGMP